MLEYQQLTDDEILHLAAERVQLTDEARLSLDAELSRRELSSSDVYFYRQQCQTAEQAEDLKRATPTYISHRGLGKKFLGKANRKRDPSGCFESYDSTLWFVVFWFPVFPIATYTVRRDLEKWLGFTVASDPIAVERHPRNWEQILLSWIKGVLVLWGIILVLRHPEWLTYLFENIRHAF